MNYTEWTALTEQEKQEKLKKSVEEMNKLSAKIDISMFNMKECITNLEEKFETYKLWHKLHMNKRGNSETR